MCTIHIIIGRGGGGKDETFHVSSSIWSSVDGGYVTQVSSKVTIFYD